MRENLYRWLAWKLPRGLVYWCYIRVAATVTTDGPMTRIPVPEIGMMDALGAYEKE